MGGKTILILLIISSATAAHAQFSLEPSKKREDSDIYLKGALTAAHREATIYEWDIKFTYPKFYRDLGRGKNWSSASPLIEFIANKGTDANPDRAKIAAQFGFYHDTSRSQGSHVTEIQWLSDIGGEFDRKFNTRSLTITSFIRPLFKTYGRDRFAFVPEIEVGTEFGNNVSNLLQKDGSGSFVRLYGGVSVYQEIGWEGVVLLFNYRLRTPFRDEIFSKKIAGTPVRTLTTKPRHYVEAGLDIAISKYLSIKPEYKWGSLPPAFSFIDNQYSISFDLKAAVIR